MDYHTRKLLGLTDEHITFDEEWLEEIEKKQVTANLIKGTLTYVPTCCENCGEISHGQIVKNGSKTTMTQLPLFKTTLTYLELKRSRFLCRSCGTTFSAQTPVVHKNNHLAKELKYQIALELKHVCSRKAIAQRYFVSDVTILRIQEEVAKTYRPNWQNLPTVLCIDEFKSMASCEGAMSFICVDGQTDQLLEILEDRRLSKLIGHFMRYSRKARLKVKYLVMDMNASYGELIKTVFPNAEIVTDRFHVVQHINRAFNQLRVNIMNQFRTHHSDDQKKYRRLKRYWKLLLKDSDKLSLSRSTYHRLFKREMYPQDVIDNLLSYHPLLKTAYDTVQLLHYYRKKQDVTGFFAVIDSLDESLPKWFKQKLQFLKKYHTGITNGFQLSYSNGVTEGINNKIKLIKRVSFGYSNFYHLRERIYIVQGLVYN